MGRNRGAHQGAIEELIANLAGGFSDQFTAMASGAMGGPDVEGVVRVVLGAEGIIAAELAALERFLQVGNDPLAGTHQAAEGALRSGAAGEQQDAIADLAVGVDPFANRAGSIAAFQGHLGDQQVAEAVEQEVGSAGKRKLDLVQTARGEPFILEGLGELAGS